MNREQQIENDLIDKGFGVVADSDLKRLREKQLQPVRAVETPLRSWNRACRGTGGGQGMGPGWYVIVTGKTGTGKTLLAQNMAITAMRSGVSVLYITLEMTTDELFSRFRSIVTGGELTWYEYGVNHNAEEALKADEAFMELPGALYVNHDPIWRLTDIANAVEHYARQGVRLVILDYAQLVVPDGSDRKLFEAMTQISAELRNAAQHNGVAAVVLSQLNRSVTSDRKAPPSIEGLYGSGRFAFDADQVVALDYSQREYDTLRRTETTRLLLLKNRHGPALLGESGIPITISYANFQITERGAL